MDFLCNYDLFLAEFDFAPRPFTPFHLTQASRQTRKFPLMRRGYSPLHRSIHGKKNVTRNAIDLIKRTTHLHIKANLQNFFYPPFLCIYEMPFSSTSVESFQPPGLPYPRVLRHKFIHHSSQKYFPLLIKMSTQLKQLIRVSALNT